jgi:hypothetical protein
MSHLWLAIVLGASLYCGVQAYRDFRRGDTLMAVLGVACLMALVLTPIGSHAVKFDLIPASAG